LVYFWERYKTNQPSKTKANNMWTETINGRAWHFEVLQNGLLSTYDYKAKWQLTFKSDGSRWVPHGSTEMNAGRHLLKSLLQRLNLYCPAKPIIIFD